MLADRAVVRALDRLIVAPSQGVDDHSANPAATTVAFGRCGGDLDTRHRLAVAVCDAPGQRHSPRNRDGDPALPLARDQLHGAARSRGESGLQRLDLDVDIRLDAAQNEAAVRSAVVRRLTGPDQPHEHAVATRRRLSLIHI